MAIDRPNEPERPVGVDNPEMGWGSDVVAEVIRQLDIPYIAMVPGASYRGFQDSLVNYLGNRDPQMLVCLHEEHCVAIAHGYAKVTDKPMAAAVHSNIGLMHATMAIFDAWCDRAPVMVFGATGPVDAAMRRPWIDWIHTSRDQGALVRDYVKWDDQPASPAAAIESVLRANRIMRRQPQGPVYIVLDVSMQESKLASVPNIPDVTRFAVEADPAPTSDAVEAAAEMLKAAKSPLIMAGRVSRNQSDWDRRVALAEALGARVITNQRTAAAFPTHHLLHPNHLNYRTTADDEALIRNADVILNLDWLDFGGTLHAAGGTDAKIISVSMDDLNSNGWSFDHHVLPAVDLPILSTPDSFVAAALEGLPSGEKRTYDVAPSAAPSGYRRDRFDLSWHGGRCGDRLTSDHLCPFADWLAGPDDPYRRAAGLYWERWRRRRGVRPRDGCRFRLGVARLGSLARRHYGRRRFLDGCFSALDGGALRHPVTADREQQPVLRQRCRSPKDNGGKPWASGCE